MAAKDFDLFGAEPAESRQCAVGERVRIAFRGHGVILAALPHRCYRVLEEAIWTFPLGDLDADTQILVAHDGLLRRTWPPEKGE